MINVVELDERINKCLSILEENPRSRIFAALAEAYRRRGDVGRAFSICKNGLRIHADYGAAHVVVAKLYLHQNMVKQARMSAERAIELDGPSRSSDLLLAEIHLASGAYPEVWKILNRFTRKGGEDKAVTSLRERLKNATQSGGVALPAASSQPVPTSLPDPPADVPPPADRKTVCTDPAQVVTEMMAVPRMTYVALYANDGTLLASHGDTGAGAEANGSDMNSTFVEIDRLLEADGWGRLSTIRIEDQQNQWGILGSEGMVAVIRGTARLGYAAALRKLTQCLYQIAAHRANEPNSAALTNEAEHLPH